MRGGKRIEKVVFCYSHGSGFRFNNFQWLRRNIFHHYNGTSGNYIRGSLDDAFNDYIRGSIDNAFNNYIRGSYFRDSIDNGPGYSGSGRGGLRRYFKGNHNRRTGNDELPRPDGPR
jgi:hypothetical protein